MSNARVAMVTMKENQMTAKKDCTKKYVRCVSVNAKRVLPVAALLKTTALACIACSVKHKSRLMN